MADSQAWVTLATNDSYSLGALVLAHALRRVGTARRLAVMVTPGVTLAMQDQLRSVYDEVKLVDVLDSQDAANLALLSRPDLGITFTKLHCWRLTNYTKCVFLDADTLVLQPCDELFEREELSAAPDPGWPDCFNSGVFVFRPSEDTYQALLKLALTTGSFDGGDQGLLNSYFSDWATKDISRHLSFLYNMCAPSHYSYLPAFKQFGEGVKIAHFIGPNKPWSQYFDSETRQVRPARGSEHLRYLFQFWWDIFCAQVHPHLCLDMSHRNLILPQLGPFTAESYHINQAEPNHTSHFQEQSHEPEALRYTFEHFNKPIRPIRPEENIIPSIEWPPPATMEHQDIDTLPLQQHFTPQPHQYVAPQHIPPPPTDTCQYLDSTFHSQSTTPTPDIVHFGQSTTPCVLPTPEALPSELPEARLDDEEAPDDAGLAGAFSTMKLGEPSPAATAEMQEHLRRAAWEQGSMDYLGADAFDNIWRKIMTTVTEGPGGAASGSSPAGSPSSDNK